MDEILSRHTPQSMPALVLAYLGDAVYELCVRKYLVERGITKVNSLHRLAIKFVNASNQAKVLHAINDELSPEEAAVVRRGRNAKSGSTPKNIPVTEYRHGTAFEALIGFLFLSGRHDRINQIFSRACDLVMIDGEESK